jgi:cytochrome P450 family 6
VKTSKMNFTDILIYFFLPLAIAGFLFLKKKFSYFEENEIPHIKPSSWVYGNVEGVSKSIHFIDMFMNVYEATKGKDVIAGFYGLFVPSIFVSDLELVKQITVKEFNTFTDRGIYVNEENEPITGHLFSLSGEKWRYLRNKLSPAFTSGKIKSMYNTISDKGDSFVAAIEKASANGTVETKDISNRFMIDIVSSCAFGMEANTMNYEHPQLVKVFRQVFTDEGNGAFRALILSVFPNMSKFINLRMFPRSVQDYFDDIVGGSISYRENNKIERNDFLNMLIQLKNKGSIDGEISTENRKLTMNECIAQAFIFFFAGADSSSTVISYAITELSHHPEIQEKLRNEILEKIESSKGEITYDNLHEMTYLNQVVNGT